MVEGKGKGKGSEGVGECRNEGMREERRGEEVEERKTRKT